MAAGTGSECFISWQMSIPKDWRSLGTLWKLLCLLLHVRQPFIEAQNGHVRAMTAPRLSADLNPMAAGTGSECFKSWHLSTLKHLRSLGKHLLHRNRQAPLGSAVAGRRPVFAPGTLALRRGKALERVGKVGLQVAKLPP